MRILASRQRIIGGWRILPMSTFTGRAGAAVMALTTILVAANVLASTAVAVEIPTDPFALQPGQYQWQPQVASAGPLVILVSLAEQRAYVYRNGIAIGFSTISSGRRDHPTPTGVFTILQKQRMHHSDLYDDAPMPFMERLTWDGIAMHGGHLPGYPASHGCVRLPQAFAERLFAITHFGDTVVVADTGVLPVTVVHPALLAPVGANGMPEASAENSGIDAFWDDAAPAEGPVSILVSVRDRKVHVIRNGVRIGSSVLSIAEGFQFHGSVVFVRLGDPVIANAVGVSSSRWSAYPLAGQTEPESMERLASHLKVSDDFVRHLASVIVPGTRVLVTDLPAWREWPPKAEPSQDLQFQQGSSAKLHTDEQSFPP